MADLDKLNSIIAKCRLLRESVGITPREFMLSDLVESLAIELLHHDRDHSHLRTIGTVTSSPYDWPTAQDITPTPQRGRVWGGHAQ